jgi:hypothetical protein
MPSGLAAASHPEVTRCMLGFSSPQAGSHPQTAVQRRVFMAASWHLTLAPPPLPAGLLTRRAESTCPVGVGESDPFLPPPSNHETRPSDHREHGGTRPLPITSRRW